jgi:hypothetical protein
VTPEQLDRWRIVPRLLVLLYGFMCWTVADWFMLLQDPTGSQVAFASTVWGAAAAWFGLYVNSGGKRE